MIGAFEFYDPEKTGFIDKSIFKHCMQDLPYVDDGNNIKPAGKGLSTEEFAEMLKVADPENTGKINYTKFL